MKYLSLLFVSLVPVFLAACQGGADSGAIDTLSVPMGASEVGPLDRDGHSIESLTARLKDVTSKVLEWDSAERIRLVSSTDVLRLLPLDAFSPLMAWKPENRVYQYGTSTVIFDVRRAAWFLHEMRPDLPPLRAADLSQSDGSTPSDSLGLRHPSGSHMGGASADLSYIAGDIEGTAWVVYSLLQSTSVISILTAYRDVLLEKAQTWFDSGVIGNEALTRLRNGLWQDTSLNHDYHMHVNTATDPGLLASPANDYYRCFKAVSGDYGTMWAKTPC